MHGKFHGSIYPPKNVQQTTNIINSKFPNGQIIISTMEGVLDLPMLPNTEILAHIFPNIKHSLVSIVELCDVVCTVKFKKKYVTAVYKEEIILRGWRNQHNKLWYFPLSVENEDEKVGGN